MLLRIALHSRNHSAVSAANEVPQDLNEPVDVLSKDQETFTLSSFTEPSERCLAVKLLCKHTFEKAFQMMASHAIVMSEIFIALNIFLFKIPFHCYGNH